MKGFIELTSQRSEKKDSILNVSHIAKISGSYNVSITMDSGQTWNFEESYAEVKALIEKAQERPYICVNAALSPL